MGISWRKFCEFADKVHKFPARDQKYGENLLQSGGNRGSIIPDVRQGLVFLSCTRL